MECSKVTIIIPVYKVEKYLRECVESVLRQDYPYIEIVLVDDGSPDKCPMLCEQLAAEYANIKVIHQKNSGQGAARNNGMSVAEGKYICFMDSDDCLDGKDAISRLVKCAEEKQADIITGSFRRFSEQNITETNHHHLHEGKYTETVDFRFKGFYMYGHLAYNWGKLYRREFLLNNDLWCPIYPFTQDKAHNMTCCAYKPKYAFINESVYLYRVNEESVTFKYKPNFMPVWISIASDFEVFLKERGIHEDYNDLMYFHIFFGSFFLVKQELQFKEQKIREAAKALKKYGRDPFVKKSMKALAKGRYLKEIEGFTWKFVIWGASLLFTLHGYLFMAAGIALLRKMEVDSKITKARYKKEKKSA